MEINKEEAVRALGIARTHRDAGKLTSALKFAKKSVSLYSTPEGVAFVKVVERDIQAAPSSSTEGKTANGGAKTTGAEPDVHPSASGMHHRHTTGAAEPANKRDFTPDQLKVVKRVKACKVHQYYEILSGKSGLFSVSYVKNLTIVPPISRKIKRRWPNQEGLQEACVSATPGQKVR